MASSGGRDGKIERVGRAADIRVPEGYRLLDAAVVTPGLIDAHSVVGLAGMLNQPHDQMQLETSAPIQPELRAIDAYNAREQLVGWLREFGVTTVHTGHAPAALVSGQTMIVKTRGDDGGRGGGRAGRHDRRDARAGRRWQARASRPGTRAKAIAMLRGELIKAQRYARDSRAA